VVSFLVLSLILLFVISNCGVRVCCFLDGSRFCCSRNHVLLGPSVALLIFDSCSFVHMFLLDEIAQPIKRRAGRPGSDFQHGQDFSLLQIVQTGFRLTQPPVQWVPGVISPGLKRPGREYYHSPAPSSEA
jgi:hypothetical protein